MGDLFYLRETCSAVAEVRKEGPCHNAFQIDRNRYKVNFQERGNDAPIQITPVPNE